VTTDTSPAPPTADDRRGQIFRYLGFDLDPDRGRVTCRYALDGREFREEVTFPGGGDWSRPAVTEAARLLFLLTGVSYYKAGAPPRIDLGDTAVTDTERDVLARYYREGLGEFAHRNGLDLSDLEIVGPRLDRAAPVAYHPGPNRPLIPFGGGLDSVVSVELLRDRTADAALFVVNRPGDRFEAIEEPARVTGLPVVRAERLLDPQILRSRELGFLNGHIPVTGIISAIAVLAAVLDGRDAVVMSNEWSASSATLVVDGREVNHQYSKSEAFETDLRALLAAAIDGGPDYFSLLRPFSELWIAERFSHHPEYLDHFRSCNRAFHIDHARRLDHWCGTCDKCAFIDLILAPFVPRADLDRVFGGREPLANPDLVDTFRKLLALTPDAKPWECVGDETECRIAARLAAGREDRRDAPVLAALIAEAAGPTGERDPEAGELLRPLGTHHVPDRYAPDALLG
jgi:UDP-N-acetyl-alpha-D-muramoyl-L-alanyl-L-glutamate epimerase